MESGLYQMNFRGLSMAECLRFGGFIRLPLALLLKAIGQKLKAEGHYPYSDLNRAPVV